MKCFAIVVKGNKLSESGYKELKDSYQKYGHEEGITVFDAIDIFKVDGYASGNGLEWNYPWEGSKIDIETGLTKTAYPTKDRRKRISCFLGHWYLWQKCLKLDEMILIVEHDTRFIKKLPTDRTFKNCNYDIIGINDPSMATRKSKEYHDAILSKVDFFQPVPTIDEVHIPQGLAGNSAYVIKPAGAKRMLHLSEKYGMWPNDALMCKQLISTLGVTRNFYTRVQGLRSTTTL